jgi:hypothetical protein
MTRKLPLTAIFVFLFTVFGLLSTGFAQSATATLSGNVQDQDGAVVPGASVVVFNKSTGLRREVTTNDEGSFTVPLLPPSTYSVTIRRDGFGPVEAKDVVLNVGDQKALQIQLKAGDVNAQVTIDSDTETVRTDGSVGTVVNRQFVANIPLNGRSLQALIQLTPGVVLTPALGSSGGATGGAQFSVNGQRTTSNYFMVDGVSANTGVSVDRGTSGPAGSGQAPGTTALGGTNSLVSLDALQEFRIQTSTFAPEYGRTPGGQISLVTRGGTERFHGSASYYFRNEALDANDWFANSRSQPKPKERQSLFAGVLGGPIKKDRLFFFGSYEWLRLKQPKAQVVTVPTLALRGQAVSALRPYLNALPLPNGPDFGDGTAEFAASYSDPAKFNVFALRLDGRVTDNLTGFFRVSDAPSEAQSRIQSLSTTQAVRARNDSYTGGVTWVAGAQLTADLRINWTRNHARFFYDLDAFGGAAVPQSSDVFAPDRDPSKATFFFDAPGGSFSWGTQDAGTQRQLNTVGIVAWSLRSHQLKFGIDYRRGLPLLGGTGLQEVLSFYSAQDILTSQAEQYQITNIDPVPREAIFSNLSLFAQDTWHGSRHLTLTYGLRFERVPPPTEARGRLPRTVLGIENDVFQDLRLAPQGTPLWRSRAGEFAPRFGAAYQLSNRSGFETTLRGGAGFFYDLGLGDSAQAFANTYPFIASKNAFGTVPFPLSAAARTPPMLGVDPPSLLQLMDPNVRLPYTIQWNIAVEQALGSAQTVTIGYVGAAGRRLLIGQTYFSQRLADFPNAETTLFIQRSIGRSAYNALQMQYQRRLRRGLQALVSYTFSQSRDNASQANLTTPATRGLLAGEFGPSDFDVRHVLSAAVTYEVPKLSGPALLRASLNGWGADLLIRYQSAYPVNPLSFPVVLPDGTFYLPRPDAVVGQPLYISDVTVPGGRRFNPAAFARPAPRQQGSFPRNGLRGFPASQVDLALRREFNLGEKVRLQLRGELFNLFNHPNFGAPVAFTFSPLFGQPIFMLNRQLGGLNALYQMGGPRSGQLAVKITF